MFRLPYLLEGHWMINPGLKLTQNVPYNLPRNLIGMIWANTATCNMQLTIRNLRGKFINNNDNSNSNNHQQLFLYIIFCTVVLIETEMKIIVVITAWNNYRARGARLPIHNEFPKNSKYKLCNNIVNTCDPSQNWLSELELIGKSRECSSWCCGLALSHRSVLYIGLISLRLSPLDWIIPKNIALFIPCFRHWPLRRGIFLS